MIPALLALTLTATLIAAFILIARKYGGPPVGRYLGGKAVQMMLGRRVKRP